MKDALPEEVKYYVGNASLNYPMVQSVFPGAGIVPLNYGGYHLEAGDASGAWVSSTIDLLRFVVKVDGRESPPDILSAGLVSEMTSNGATLCSDGSCYYAGGWVVRPVQDGATWSHGGDLPGTKAILVRSYYNVSWAESSRQTRLTALTMLKASARKDAVLGRRYREKVSARLRNSVRDCLSGCEYHRAHTVGRVQLDIADRQ